MNLTEQKQLVTKYIHTALARWANEGFDHKHGTFLEALDFAGQPLPDLDRRGRVQGRQVYVYALAHLWGYDPEGTYLALAQRGWDASKAVYLTSDGGWIFSATPEGEPINTEQYVYERAFTIMALSALYQATDDQKYEADLAVAWAWLTTMCASPNGGFNLGVPFDPSVPREQNPHMHLFEACMDARNLNGGVWAKQADKLFDLSINRFISPTGALIEFFTQDWRPDPKTGADLQPGHLMEWTWLLTQYGKAKGIEIPQIERLYEGGRAWGLDENGLGIDEMREGGEVLRGTKRLWVECEVLKAHCARYETTKDVVYLERAQAVLAKTFELYLHEDTGCWFDQLDTQDKNISKNAPASSFYHLLLALHEFLRVADL